jgi:peptidyl-dipeptidase Dcp
MRQTLWMRSLFFSLLIVLVTFIGALASVASADSVGNFENSLFLKMNNITETNPLLEKWSGNYGGVPAFDKVAISQFKPALETAMAENLSEIDKIATNSEPATFENTIVAMEKAGNTLSRVSAVFGVWSGNLNNDEFAKVETEMSPKLAEFGDKITQNAALFQRIKAVYDANKTSKLTAIQKRLTTKYYNSFVRSGAKLDVAQKAKVSEINQKLARNFTKFSQNLLADEAKYLLIENEADLAGLPDDLKASAAEQATSKKLKGWLIANTRSSVDPFLTYSERRDLREKVFKLFVNRGDNADATDNNLLIADTLRLRAERAKLLGFATHAHWSVANVMAKTPERTMNLMEAVWKPAVARVHEEVADMQKFADKAGDKITIEAWDYRFYMEKVRKERYDLDQNEVKQYFQLDKMREGMFWVAGELFNFTFAPVNDVPVFHPDVKVWKVSNKTTGKLVGLWYFDPFAREGKGSGAWMNQYRNQQKLIGDIPTIVSNNSNFVKGKDGEPVLISWDDANTLFHEFGHALHGLSSNVMYPSQSGTNVATDYVEFPSQILERWVSTPEVLNKFALHYKTGKPIPKTLVDKIKKAATFNEGFATVEYMASALVDMKLHLAGDKKLDIDTFERETLAELKMPKEMVMRHRLPHFGHLFSSDGYAAGYYSYIWSDVISSDAYAAFTEGKGAYDKKVAAKLVKYVFSVGDTIDPAEGYKMFRGRDPKVEALMVQRGFPVARKVKSKKAK